MPTPCHILVEGNPVIIYASRAGSPEKILPVLKPFLQKFWQERETLGVYTDTPECLVAQIVVRFGFEICEDDFSNLRVGMKFHPAAEYLYQILSPQDIRVWVPETTYHQDPQMGLAGCRRWVSAAISP